VKGGTEIIVVREDKVGSEERVVQMFIGGSEGELLVWKGGGIVYSWKGWRGVTEERTGVY